MKTELKIIFWLTILILGSALVIYGPNLWSLIQPDEPREVEPFAEIRIKGPTGPPSVKGPTGPPPE